MRAKDLHKYKPLDITQLPGKEWNIADKVLGLDENDKVVMAEPEEAVTPEYVDNAIDQAMEAETARTESTYLKEHQSLDDYYTKEEVDQAIEDVEVDLSNYYTKAEVDEAIENVDVSDQLVNYALISSVTADINTAIANETARTENTYAKPSDIPSLDGYAKTTAVTQDIQTAMASETARTENVYAKKSEVPDLDDYYTKSETDEAIEEAISGISLEGYWTSAETKNYVDSEITGATASETARTESTYAKKSEIPSLDGYATEQYVDEAIADIPQVDLSAYAKTTAVTEDIQTAMAAETARTDGAYVKVSVMPTFIDNITINGEGDATGMRKNVVRFNKYDSSTGEWAGKDSRLYFSVINGESIVSTFAGGADNIILPTFNDVATAITEAIENETGRTESTYAKKTEIPSLDGYWTSAQTENAITAATDDMATETWVGEQGYLTQHQDISGKLDVSTFNTYTGATATVLDGKADISDIPDVSDFVTSGEVATQIGTAMASETARTESTYLKEHQDISGKLDKTDFNTYTGATATALEGKVDLTTYTAYTGSTATAIAAKQDTLVSGTNIKTINNQSLLGSGNIDIQGGGGGGDNVVELTKAQYKALDPPAADTTYIITDADVVDLNDYAPASGLTELSGTVETINSNYATKQSVTARASNSNYLPGWNAQGVITGSTAYYNKSQGINGTNYNVFSNSNTNHPAIFAPTSAGTAGQPLLSNGSGAPVWGGYKFAFISQSQYDALTTPDATTIYFIVDPN